MRVLFILFLFLSSLFSLGLSGQNFLPADQAFKISSKVVNSDVVVSIKLADKIHIYDDELKFAITKPVQKDLTKDAIKPAPHKDSMGSMVYNKSFETKIPLSKINQKNFTLKVSLMGCSDKGLCYPPVTKTFDLKADVVNTAKVSKTNKKPLSEEGKIVDTLKHGSLMSILGMFFGFGLLLSLTPCIFPMIPILSSIIVSSSKGKEITLGRGLFLSVIYILSMSVAYTVAGVIAGLFGAEFNIQAAMQNPYVLIVFALIFVALAFSMFGYYEIQLPQSLQTKLSNTSNKAGDKGGLIGVAIMGFLSALIVGPCVAPALAGALVYIGQTGDAVLGGAALFVMSLGMGVPLLFVGAGAGKFMPKPGGWMTKVSQIFGVVMLALAIWMLDRILEPTTVMFLWAFLLIGTGIFFGALEAQQHTGAKKIFKVITVVLLLLGIFELIGAVSKATNPLNPFERFTTTKSSLDIKKSDFTVIKDEKELEKIIKTSKKPVMIDFSAKWCVSCKELEENTFKNPQVSKLMENFKLLRIDITDNTEFDKKMLTKFNLVGPPAVIFYKDGEEVMAQKIIGYKPPEVFIPVLKNILGK